MRLARQWRWAALVTVAWAALAGAQARADDPVLVESGDIKVYRSEYEAELLKLAPEIRAGFNNSQRRISDLLTRLLVQKSLAAQPETKALAQAPQNATRIRLEADRVLAQLLIEDIERRASQAFDARRDQYEARARELYAVDRQKYEIPEQVSASHILFDLKKHSSEEARKLAEQARARVLAGADFNAVAKEVSEDPSAGQNAGKLGFFGKAEMDPAFANAAFALAKPGDVSAPVLSSFGWHVIKLEERRPATQRSYEQVREILMTDLKRRYIDEQREAALAAVRDDPRVQIHREAVDALYVRPRNDLPSALQGPAGAPSADRAAEPAVGAPSAGSAAEPAAGASAPAVPAGTSVPTAPSAPAPRRPGTPPPGMSGGPAGK